MTNESLVLLDKNKKEIREKILSDIYQNNKVPTAFLNVTDLDIYSKDSSFFSKIGKAVRTSFLDNNIILTNEQEECLSLLSKQNLFISAPTSFGKTFIALEHIARNSEEINSVIFVVPTIALMNELRKKCFHYFSNMYTLITSDSELEQYYSEKKKIIIVVPERINAKLFQKYLNTHKINLLVYDEIYKLNADPNINNNNSRLIKMNYTYKYLIEKSDKILLLGPFIRDVNFSRSKLKIQKYITNLNLVYNQVNYEESFSDYYGKTEDKRFIYFKSPSSIVRFLNKHPADLPEISYDETIVNWMSENIHPDWYYVNYLKQGIGIHHGKTPVFLRKYIESEYADGNIHTILCTSTLVEGINTPTNSLVVHDTPRGVFELNNLIGRVGRLNIQNPKVGEIYLTSKETMDLYNPDEWIDLNILYETEEILTKEAEDESLYLSKEKDGNINENIRHLAETLSQYEIDLSEVMDAGLEFRVLERFLNIYDRITKHSKDFYVIKDIKFSILKEFKFLSGLKIGKYSFANENTDSDDYLPFDSVYLLLTSTSGMKSVISRFTSEFPKHTVSDINLFIDTLFQIDEYIKFEMMKVVSIYDLFDSKGLFTPMENRAFIQSINMIKNYSNSPDGYERILSDLGFPEEDVQIVRNTITDYQEIKGTENKLKKLQNESIFSELSPFGKKIIKEL